MFVCSDNVTPRSYAPAQYTTLGAVEDRCVEHAHVGHRMTCTRCDSYFCSLANASKYAVYTPLYGALFDVAPVFVLILSKNHAFALDALFRNVPGTALPRALETVMTQLILQRMILFCHQRFRCVFLSRARERRRPHVRTGFAHQSSPKQR